MTERVHVEFEITDYDKFLDGLQRVTGVGEPLEYVVVGYRADDQVQRREALTKFVDQMELKLRKNEHKRNWRDKPIEALFKLLLLEVEEFKVAHEFFSVDEAKGELVDVANFAMMVWDRLSLMDQERNAREQQADNERKAEANERLAEGMRRMQNALTNANFGNQMQNAGDWMK